MKISTLAFPTLLLALALPLAACGDEDGPSSAVDPGSSSSDQPDQLSDVPAAPGKVRSRHLPTVMDTGDGAQLCLGAIAESYPPQCGGPAITNWDWDSESVQGMFDEQGDIRWGTFAVTGTWDGTSFTVTDAIPGPLYDPMPEEPVVLPDPSVDYSQSELDNISNSLNEEIPGYQGSYADQEGHVLADVLYDDGSLQDYADATYGDGVVVVTGALVDVA